MAYRQFTISSNHDPGIQHERKKNRHLGTGGNSIDILDTLRRLMRKRQKYLSVRRILDDNEHLWGKNFMALK